MPSPFFAKFKFLFTLQHFICIFSFMNTLYYFEPNQFYVFLTGFVLLAASIGVFEFLNRTRLSLFLMLMAGMFLCSFSAILDPFLNNWDEQFHALVAKHLTTHPLTPTLYEKTLLPYDPTIWIGNHIWLHKQPLFLWQIALSLKLFGINEFAVRLPSVLMMSIAPLLVFRIGKISMNERIGFYGALLFASSFFVHELLTGFPPSEHNDIAFLFYITASIWAWVEYEQSQKKKWLILIGLFAGCAILVKWLAGLLVFSGWGISILADKENRFRFQHYKPLLLSLFVCLAVFMPWQLYILNAFPAEASYEFGLNNKHFFTVVEDHGGDALYYFNNLNKVYGEGLLVPFVIIISLLFLFKNRSQNKFAIAFFCFIGFTYFFFTLAATKMVGFCFIVSPLIFLSLASLIYSTFEFLKRKALKTQRIQPIVITALLVLIAWGNFNLYKIAYKHTMLIRPNDNDKRIDKINEAQFIKSLPACLPSEDYVVFNCKAQKNIGIMFYTNLLAYDKALSFEEYTRLKAQGIKLATINNGKLPEYLLNDASVIKILPPDTTWN